MDFSANSVWEMTKLFVSDPAEASRRILAISWPVNVSVVMIVLAGIISGVMWALDQSLFGAAPQQMLLPDGREILVQPATPVVVGVYSAVIGLLFSYLTYWVGVRSGGKGSLAGVLAVMAALQIALTVLGVIAGIVGIALPLAGFIFAVGLIYVSLRGYGHAVRESHGFETMGRAVMVLIAAILLSVFALLILSMLLTPILMPDLMSEVENAL
ncbi:MAG: YIP1 family protein [Pseudomonadota bacterium]